MAAPARSRPIRIRTGFRWTTQRVRGPSPGSNLRSSDGPPVQRHALTAARFVRIRRAPRWLPLEIDRLPRPRGGGNQLIGLARVVWILAAFAVIRFGGLQPRIVAEATGRATVRGAFFRASN